MTSRSSKGMTLIELIMALGITIVAVAVASTIVVQAALVTRRGEESANNNDASRFAGDVLAQSLMSAGVGASNGLYVAASGGTSNHLVSPIMALNNPPCTQPSAAVVCPDEMWVVLPHRNALRNSCDDTGGGVMVQNVAGGSLTLRCSSGISSTSFPILMATNMLKGALLSNPVFNTSGTWPKIISYAEYGTGYSDTPERGGFQVGDLVYPVSIVHYYVANVDNATPGDLVGDSAKGHTAAHPAPTALFARQAIVSTAFTSGKPPFTDATTGTYLQLVQTDIEDLQLAFGFDTKGTGDPGDVQYSPWNSSWNDSFRPYLRSVRVNVVSKSSRAILDSNGAQSSSGLLAPVVVEDHAPSTTPDGRSRNQYMRRVELPNMAPGNI